MTITLALLGLLSVAYVCLWTPFAWRITYGYSLGLIISFASIIGWLIAIHLASLTIALVYLVGFLLFNLLRVIRARMHPVKLYTATRRTALFLIVYVWASIAVFELLSRLNVSSHVLLTTVAGIVAVINAQLFISTKRHIKAVNRIDSFQPYADRDLPTVTVAIPARNETDELRQCLESLIATQYPKLEIIVLDDCSQQRRTPEIIRQFAHDGVRFLAGEVPPKQWLAKNYAYQQLLEASSGEVILYCGVDVRFDVHSIRLLIEQMVSRNKQMISVMPINKLPNSLGLENILMQANRYAWELALPRRKVARPSVLSTVWMARRTFLVGNGGFAAVSHSINPESYFARHAVSDNDSYSFIASNRDINLRCDKAVEEQRSTAVRTRYPQLHQRPEAVALQILVEIAVLLVPYVLFIVALLLHSLLAVILAGLAIIFGLLFYGAVVRETYRLQLLRGYLLLPFAAVLDICVLLYSMWRYELYDVIWKDRNVCIPMMEVIPRLPKV